MRPSGAPVGDNLGIQSESRTAWTEVNGQSDARRPALWREERFWVPPSPERHHQAGSLSPTLPKANWYKRSVDIFLGILFTVFFAPLMAVIALAVCLDGGPVLYGQLRIGPDRMPFRCWKFRTMVVSADQVLEQVLTLDEAQRAEWKNSFKLRNDPRITLVGRFLRAYSLDEFPQLFNVIWGEMSLVGPRPIVEDEIELYGPNFLAYSACRPGMTGLWQIRGRSDVSYERRVQLDTEYARTWSLWLDFKILLSTVATVVRGDGAY
jgi:lipopolysaccharide/colanic/teichoic acid biosynthesis glycosyltransferase